MTTTLFWSATDDLVVGVSVGMKVVVETNEVNEVVGTTTTGGLVISITVFDGIVCGRLKKNF